MLPSKSYCFRGKDLVLICRILQYSAIQKRALRAEVANKHLTELNFGFLEKYTMISRIVKVSGFICETDFIEPIRLSTNGVNISDCKKIYKFENFVEVDRLPSLSG